MPNVAKKCRILADYGELLLVKKQNDQVYLQKSHKNYIL